MQYGSLNNQILAESRQPVPCVGMGATILGWTDRKACTVVEAGEIRKAPMIRVREDDVRVTGTENAYVRRESGPTRCFTLRKSGFWVEKGEPAKSGSRVVVGIRDHFRDREF